MDQERLKEVAVEVLKNHKGDKIKAIADINKLKEISKKPYVWDAVIAEINKV